MKGGVRDFSSDLIGKGGQVGTARWEDDRRQQQLIPLADLVCYRSKKAAGLSQGGRGECCR